MSRRASASVLALISPLLGMAQAAAQDAVRQTYFCNIAEAAGRLEVELSRVPDVAAPQGAAGVPAPMTLGGDNVGAISGRLEAIGARYSFTGSGRTAEFQSLIDPAVRFSVSFEPSVSGVLLVVAGLPDRYRCQLLRAATP